MQTVCRALETRNSKGRLGPRGLIETRPNRKVRVLNILGVDKYRVAQALGNKNSALRSIVFRT